MFFFGDYQGGRTSKDFGLTDDRANLGLPIGKPTAALGPKLCYSANASSNGVCGGALSSPLMVPTTEGGMIQAQQNMVFNPNTGNSNGSGRKPSR